MKSNKPSTYKNIPAKFLIENVDICGPYITKFINNAIAEANFPNSLKNRYNSSP